jgi:DNA uptake protein ComE-like DNA-binding protein
MGAYLGRNAEFIRIAVLALLRTSLKHLISVFVLISLATFAGCSSTQDQRDRDEKTREEVAKATERAKPELQEAGREIGQAAKQAAEGAKAAAQGVREGWNRNGDHRPLDLNSATEDDLASLPGITHREARKIIAARPYRNKHEVVSRGVISESAYQKIRDYTKVD